MTPHPELGTVLLGLVALALCRLTYYRAKRLRFTPQAAACDCRDCQDRRELWKVY